ncbi:MAG: ORF6N domain-containing protein [Candidatus Firestonebacteria bacterium]
MEKPVIKEYIESKIYLIRGRKVMLSRDLASLYGVETRYLNRQVLRNIERFPENDFMFQISKEEYEVILKCRIGASSWGGARRALPYAFTEHGILMLSSVLNSDRAIRINIEIMKVFVSVREYLSTHKEIAEKLSKIESKLNVHDEVIKDIIDQIRRMITVPAKPKKQIGFRKE